MLLEGIGVQLVDWQVHDSRAPYLVSPEADELMGQHGMSLLARISLGSFWIFLSRCLAEAPRIQRRPR